MPGAMPNQSPAEALAGELLEAQTQRRAVATASSRTDLDEASAYAVHWALVEQKRAALSLGVRGYKLGMTDSEVGHKHGGVAPVYGALLADAFTASGSSLARSELLQPYVEAEVGLRLLSAVPADVTPDDLQDISEICLSIEIPDSRYALDCWPAEITVLDLICDQSCVGRVVVGETTLEGRHIDRVLDEELVLSNHGQVVAKSMKKPSRLDPMDGVAWLARRLGERGIELGAGTIISTGRMINEVIPADQGADFELRCPGLGQVSVHMV